MKKCHVPPSRHFSLTGPIRKVLIRIKMKERVEKYKRQVILNLVRIGMVTLIWKRTQKTKGFMSTRPVALEESLRYNGIVLETIPTSGI